MPTIQQLVRKGRSPKVVKTKAPALKANPQQRGHAHAQLQVGALMQQKSVRAFSEMP